jgi:SAM-dependent methyltransferase
MPVPVAKFEKLATRLLPRLFLPTAIYRMIDRNPEEFLDIGCGTGSVVRELLAVGPRLRGSYMIGADIWLPYLKIAKKVFHDTVRCDARRLPFRAKSLDLILSSDVLEHLEKSEGMTFLGAIEKIARRQVFVFTPVGHNLKTSLEDMNPWQKHKSGWSVAEFRSRGYQVRGMSGVKLLYKERCDYRIDSMAFWPLMAFARIWSSVITFSFAESAYHMLCVKEQVSKSQVHPIAAA